MGAVFTFGPEQFGDATLWTDGADGRGLADGHRGRFGRGPGLRLMMVRRQGLCLLRGLGSRDRAGLRPSPSGRMAPVFMVVDVEGPIPTAGAGLAAMAVAELYPVARGQQVARFEG